MAAATSLSLAESLMREVAGIRRVVRRRLHGRLGFEALTGAQVELLRAVETAPGIGVAAVAKSLHLAGNTVSSQVNQLIDGGYLDRRPDPADRRAVCLHLTAPASERLRSWRAARSELVGRALDALPSEDQAAIEWALPALRRLATVLEEES
jgi:DNA-binding MarR family transcriptional regulator